MLSRLWRHFEEPLRRLFRGYPRSLEQFTFIDTDPATYRAQLRCDMSVVDTNEIPSTVARKIECVSLAYIICHQTVMEEAWVPGVENYIVYIIKWWAFLVHAVRFDICGSDEAREEVQNEKRYVHPTHHDREISEQKIFSTTFSTYILDGTKGEINEKAEANGFELSSPWPEKDEAHGNPRFLDNRCSSRIRESKTAVTLI
ncbi:unnamed protein product [Victoria cruziana]